VLCLHDTHICRFEVFLDSIKIKRWDIHQRNWNMWLNSDNAISNIILRVGFHHDFYNNKLYQGGNLIFLVDIILMNTKYCLLHRVVLHVSCCCKCLFLYGTVCYGALKLGMSSLFASFFLWKSLQFILLLQNWYQIYAYYSIVVV